MRGSGDLPLFRGAIFVKRAELWVPFEETYRAMATTLGTSHSQSSAHGAEVFYDLVAF